MKPWMEFLLVGGGGALGAMSRIGISQLAEKYVKGDFPFGTFVANMIGCLFVGVLIGSGRSESSQTWKLAFGTGFLGALTTFSAFGAETVNSANGGSAGIAFANVAANLIVGLAAVSVGIWLGKSLIASTDV